MSVTDLHTHTTASDGQYSPERLVRLAKEKGLQVIAVTDHDTVDGLENAMQTGKKLGVRVLPGVEISTQNEGEDIHLLGYCVDYTNSSFQKKLKDLRDVRRRRNELLIKRLNELGIEISMKDVLSKQKTPGGTIGRPHIAQTLVEMGVVSTVSEAFTHYIGSSGRAYVSVPRISTQDAIHLVRSYGGIPVLAHPGLYEQSDVLVNKLISIGLKGIEAYHPEHDERDVHKYEQLAREYQLLVTGGSDFHGEREGEYFHAPLGSQRVPLDTVEQLITHLESH